MERISKVILYMVAPTLVAFSVFYFIFVLFQQYINPTWLIAIPFTIVSIYITKENINEWKIINQG